MTALWLNRYIIETTSPMAINSGRRETGFDTQLARDANNLPYIPSTSFTGVWRHLTKQLLGEQIEKQWFGSIDKNNADANTPKLHIQHGLLLDSQGNTVLGLLPVDKINKDPLLQRLVDSSPVVRDHVRINDRGVAVEKGKYDKILLPKGVRFCIDVRWQGNEEYENQWLQLQELLLHPQFALGSSTRNGLGRFKLIANSTEKILLNANPNAGDKLNKFAQRLELPTKTNISIQENQPFAVLSLVALGAWRCGKGTRPLGTANEHTDSYTYSEPYISWQTNQAVWSTKPQAVLCGSSIKGILAHRMAYHYRRITGDFAENMTGAKHKEWEQRPDELRNLLGEDNQESDSLLAGKLIVEDVVIDNINPQVRTYTSIDRFTGGVRYGALYSEEILWQPQITLKLHIAPNTNISQNLKDAFEFTLEDLKIGLLPLGAGSGRGSSLVIHDQNKPWNIQWQQIGIQEE